MSNSFENGHSIGCDAQHGLPCSQLCSGIDDNGICFGPIWETFAQAKLLGTIKQIESLDETANSLWDIRELDRSVEVSQAANKLRDTLAPKLGAFRYLDAVEDMATHNFDAFCHESITCPDTWAKLLVKFFARLRRNNRHWVSINTQISILKSSLGRS